MAALAASAVASYPTNGGYDRLPEQIPGIVLVSKKLTLTGQGGATNTIGAAALGLTRIFAAYGLWDAENSKGYPTVVDPVNNVLILLDVDALPHAPVDVTSNAAYVTVLGSSV